MINKLPSVLGLEPGVAEQRMFERRGRMFLVKDLPSEVVEVSFHGRTERLEPSRPNGHFAGQFRISAETATDVEDGSWITFDAVLRGHVEQRFRGKSQLVGRNGWSVVSDIDDTIKISNVANRRELLRGTFFEPFKAVPGMSQAYRAWAEQGAVFHYVSASPWQLYPALDEFMGRERFPDGTFHLKTVRINDETFFDLFGSQDKHKRPLIEHLLKTWPKRRFVLVGDGGEQDPEIFAAMARLYPDQVAAVLIRDSGDQAAADTRYVELFRALPRTRWAVFKDGAELPSLAVLNQAGWPD